MQALLDGSLVLVADVSEAATDDVVEDWAAAPAPAAAWTGSDVPFITVRGTQLMAGQSPFYYVGANVPMAAALASRGAGGDRRRLEAELDALVALGITHVRVLGASEGPDSEPWRIVPSLQPCPGVFDADALDGLHYAVYALGRRKLRATVALGNEWPWSGGFAQYVAWARRLRAGATPDVLCEEGRSRTGDLHNATWRARGFQRLPYPGPGGHAWEAWQDYAGAFYADGLAQSLWRRAVERIVHTVNKYTGVSLAADPTVAIWQLGNEPRAPQARVSHAHGPPLCTSSKAAYACAAGRPDGAARALPRVAGGCVRVREEPLSVSACEQRYGRRHGALLAGPERAAHVERVHARRRHGARLADEFRLVQPAP